MEILVMVVGVFLVMAIQRKEAQSGNRHSGIMGLAIIILVAIMILSSYKNPQPPTDTATSVETSTEAVK